MTQIAYTDDKIYGMTDLEHIYHRTSAYISDKGKSGMAVCIREIFDNSVDELSLITNGSGELDVIMFVDRKNTSYTVSIRDNGRGIPVGPKLIASFADAKTSGKFSADAGYVSSGGLFGVGGTVAMCLSSWFRVISFNKKIVGDVTLHRENIPKSVNTIPNFTHKTGTTVLLTPDKKVFSEFQEYIDNYGDLVETFAKMSLFSKFRIRFWVIERNEDKLLQKLETKELIEYLDKLQTNTIPIFDNLGFDKDKFLKMYFGITRKWDGELQFSGSTSDDRLEVDGRMFIQLSTIPAKNKITFVNTLLFSDDSSVHISLLYRFLKENLSQKITDKAVKTFFVDHYRLPIWLYLNVRYNNAQFSGYAKTSFRDLTIKPLYNGLLQLIFPAERIGELYCLLKDHITAGYAKFSNKDFAVGSMRNLMSRLNRPDKFDDCSTSDRMSAELFLVEGDSANSDDGRDPLFQASYTLGGKPFNGMTDTSHTQESINAIKKNAISQDIIRILNITPGSSDLSNLNFGKTFIMADADTHGYHITNILIGNLYLLCPALIENGHVFITAPPLYSLNAKNSNPIYVRNASELNATLAYHVYTRFLDIAIESSVYKHTLSREEFTVFAELVIKISDEIERLSEEYMIPALLLEQLSLVTNHINLQWFSAEKVIELERWLGYDIKHIGDGNLLIISIGSEDIVVPLDRITDLIYDRILPMYREFYYGKTRIFVTTKNTKALKNSPISIIQLNELFKRLDGLFTVERYKGLGSMPPADIAANCVAPATRRVYQITNIGDLSVIFSMLGNDSSERKKLVLS